MVLNYITKRYSIVQNSLWIFKILMKSLLRNKMATVLRLQISAGIYSLIVCNP